MDEIYSMSISVCLSQFVHLFPSAAFTSSLFQKTSWLAMSRLLVDTYLTQLCCCWQQVWHQTSFSLPCHLLPAENHYQIHWTLAPNGSARVKSNNLHTVYNQDQSKFWLLRITTFNRRALVKMKGTTRFKIKGNVIKTVSIKPQILCCIYYYFLFGFISAANKVFQLISQSLHY